MNNFTKVLVGSSLVLSAALFSIGCGNGDSCCDQSTPPKAVIEGLVKDGTKNLSAGTTSFQVNGLEGISTDDGTITNYEWVVLNDTASNFTDGTVIFTGVANPTLPITASTKKICLRVTDNDGLQDVTCTNIDMGEVGQPTAVISNMPTQTLSEKCPLPLINANDSVSGQNASSITNYAWTIDGISVGGNTPTLNLATYKSNLGEGTHPVCLIATNNLGEISSPECSNIVIVNAAPTVAMTVINENDINSSDLSEGGVLAKATTYRLSCDGSADDCPENNDSLTCNWSARSFKKITGLSCADVSEANQTAHIADCFGLSTNPDHDGSDNPTTTVPNANDFTNIKTCNTSNLCVVINVSVTDNINGLTSAPLTKIFSLQ